MKGRDKLWDVLEQESAPGSEVFEDESFEEMQQRIMELDDLRGDWLPQGAAAAPGPVPTATTGQSAPRLTEAELRRKTVRQLRELCELDGILANGRKKETYINALLNR